MIRVLAALVLLLASMPFGVIAAHAAVEARCTALAGNCICSAPMNTATFTKPFNGPWFLPADSASSTAPCTVGDPQFYAGAPIESNATVKNWNTITSAADPQGAIYTALPAGHLPGLAVQATQDGTGNQTFGFSSFIGPRMVNYPNAPTARRAIRMYIYFSPTFRFTGDPSPDCENSGKVFQLSEVGGGIPSITNGGWNLHAWGFENPQGSGHSMWGFTLPFDCCIIQPGQDATSLSTPMSAYKGKWWRNEWVFRNLPGPQLRVEGYMTNVTDNGPTFKVMDSSIPQSEPVGDQWTQAKANALMLESGGWWHVWDFFRRTSFGAGGSQDPNRANCSGYAGWTHLMMAAWNTDAGQFIGAATEVEGGGGGPTVQPPSAPVNLTVTPSGVAGSFGVALLIGMLIVRRWFRA